MINGIACTINALQVENGTRCMYTFNRDTVYINYTSVQFEDSKVLAKYIVISRDLLASFNYVLSSFISSFKYAKQPLAN